MNASPTVEFFFLIVILLSRKRGLILTIKKGGSKESIRQDAFF